MAAFELYFKERKSTTISRLDSIVKAWSFHFCALPQDEGTVFWLAHQSETMR